MSVNEDVGKVAIALGFFASAIKSGELWSPTCDKILREAQEALTRLANKKKA